MLVELQTPEDSLSLLPIYYDVKITILLRGKYGKILRPPIPAFKLEDDVLAIDIAIHGEDCFIWKLAGMAGILLQQWG